MFEVSPPGEKWTNNPGYILFLHFRRMVEIDGRRLVFDKPIRAGEFMYREKAKWGKRAKT